jgi:predicted transposase
VRIVKITLKAILINETDEQKQKIDNMMLVFCTAMRHSFKRLLENNIKINELEKIISKKYNLNIRQAKDAVESARQTILSQKELVKVNYENYLNKVKAIGKILNGEKNISQKKRNTLISKLDKRQRKSNYFKYFIDNNTIPPVIFGSKEMFIRR